MYLKSLMILTPEKVIRDIEFKQGMNLIIDSTPVGNAKSTGNNVGKTTVLKLIDFCLGAKANIIYSDTENNRDIYSAVKDYLTDNNVEIVLTLVDTLDNSCKKEVEIRRNFLSGKKVIREVNGEQINDKDFDAVLERNILPEKDIEKPSFRQVISHNIRYKDYNISHTIKTLDRYTKDVEYETLYLYMLGCSFTGGTLKQNLMEQYKQEIALKERLEKKQDKTTCKMALSVIDDVIINLNKKKESFNLDENFEQNLETLNYIKAKISEHSSNISRMKIKQNLIEESIHELEENKSSIDMVQLRNLYNEATMNIANIQKSFEDLVKYHNEMLIEKIRFISKGLPELNEQLHIAQEELSCLLNQEKELSTKIAKSDSFSELEEIIADLNEQYRQKGELENKIQQIVEIESNILELKRNLDNIDKYIFSNAFSDSLSEKVMKFNLLFSNVSQKLYDESYILSFRKIIDKNGQPIYKFESHNANLSSGKRQGEILCFDLAYTLFADEENIPCLHFLLNDKKELMHDNQLVNVAEYIREHNIQIVLSILEDKLPQQVLDTAHIAVKLSPMDKLFRIENQS